MDAMQPGTDDWARTRDSHAELSPVDVHFREFAQRTPECLRRASFSDPEREILLQFPRQPWPLFVSPEVVERLAAAAIAVSGLIRSIPARIFSNDTTRMAAHYGLDRDFLRLVLARPNGIAEALSRGDFIFTTGGFKCTELNIGGNLGGIDNAVVAEMALHMPAIRRFMTSRCLRVSHRDTFPLLAGYVIRRALAAGLARDEVNAALVMGSYDPARQPLVDRMIREYAALPAEIQPGLRGRLFVCKYGDLAIEQGAVHCAGTRVHAVVEGDQIKTVSRVLRCFKMGTLHLYNGPLSNLLSDKRNLALVSQAAESDALTSEERAVIAQYIPWSRRLVPGPVTRHGEREDLLRLVLAKRQELVLKKAHSYGGADVVLGRESSPEVWEHAVRAALPGGNWIVQEYLASRPYLFQQGDEGCSAHTMIWGPFVFGGEFGGTFMRVLPEATGGVVNIARGGASTVLLEVED